MMRVPSGSLCCLFVLLSIVLASSSSFYCHNRPRGRVSTVLSSRYKHRQHQQRQEQSSPWAMASSPCRKLPAIPSVLISRRSQTSPNTPLLFQRRGGATSGDATIYEPPEPIALHATTNQPTVPPSNSFRTRLCLLPAFATEVMIAAWAPCVLVALNIWAYRSRHNVFPLEQEEMAGSKVLVRGEWHRLFTSLFVHDRQKELVVSCAGLLSAGTLCSLVFGPLEATVIYLVSGLSGNLLKLGVDALARRMTGKVYLASLRDRFGGYFGDLGVPPSQSAAGSAGAVLGLVAALWTAAIRELGVRDLRTLPPWARGLFQVNQVLAIMFGAASGLVLFLETVFPRLGKVSLIGGILGGTLCGALMPYKLLTPSGAKPIPPYVT